jgi:hypothetical protein
MTDTITPIPLVKPAARIALGVKLLDERADGWVENIDLDNLRVHRSDSCVLCQVYETTRYADGRVKLGIDYATARRAGFTAGTKAEYEDLDQMWGDYVRARREGGIGA